MSIRALALLSAATLGCAAPAARRPQDLDPVRPPSGPVVLARQLNFGSGVLSYEDEGFGELDDQLVFTIDYCEPMDLGALRLEGGLHWAYDDTHETIGGQDVRLKGRTFDASVGVNLSQSLGRLRPYFGIGGSLLFLELRAIDEATDTVFDDDEVTVGGYAKAGMLFQVTRSAHIGIEFRHFEGGDVTLEGTELDTSHDEILFVLGTSFE